MHALRDVARLAEVSVATASRVLNKKGSVRPKLVQRVLRASEDLNHHTDHVAPSLKTRPTSTIGIVIPDVTNPFFTAVIRGVESEALLQGYSLIFCDSNEDPSL